MEENRTIIDFIETSATLSHELPWFCGCEYNCQICVTETKFYTPESLRNHADKEHGSFWNYLVCANILETKAIYFKCQLCDARRIRRNYKSVKEHFRQEHPRVTFANYSKILKNYEKNMRLHNPRGPE